MTNKPTVNCDPDLLRRSLDDQLSESEEESLSAHLCECDVCQHELENLAGRPAAWNRVGTALKAGSSSLPGVAVEHAVDHGSASDFAVEWLEPSSLPESLGRLGDIEIQDVIGHGGMGVVLKGYQPELKRVVAVKVLAPQLAVSVAARKRFAREAQATAAILHPNVMPILTVHSDGKLPFIVMPYVTCESLQERIDRTGTLELVDILRIGMQTASGLAAAHAQGLVYRDVKPANILLELSVEKVMLTDFGLARAIDDASLTRTGVITGTPLYMSPEQARGEQVDVRSDLFSLGSVLYTLATGRPPFRAESTYGILRRVTDHNPRDVREMSPQLPAWFEAIVRKLLAKQPAERFESASEVAQLLEGCLAHFQQPGTVALPTNCPTWSHSKRRRLLTTCAVIAVCVGVLACEWHFVFGDRNQPTHSTILPSGDPPRASSPDVQQPAAVTADSATDWDGGENEVAPLRADFEQWQKHADQLWGEHPP
jgi:serine/threonine protein kinase